LAFHNTLKNVDEPKKALAYNLYGTSSTGFNDKAAIPSLAKRIQFVMKNDVILILNISSICPFILFVCIILKYKIDYL